MALRLVHVFFFGGGGAAGFSSAAFLALPLTLSLPPWIPFLPAQGRARPSLAQLYNWRYRNLGDLPNVRTQPAFKQANAGFAFDYQLIGAVCVCVYIERVLDQPMSRLACSSRRAAPTPPA